MSKKERVDPREGDVALFHQKAAPACANKVEIRNARGSARQVFFRNSGQKFSPP